MAIVYPKQCSALRRSDFAMLKGHPCKIMHMATSKPGKHGHAKIHLIGFDVFDGKKYEEICPSTHKINCPRVEKIGYILLDVSKDGFAELMDTKGKIRADVKLCKEFYEEYHNNQHSEEEVYEVTLLSVLDKEKVISLKKTHLP